MFVTCQKQRGSMKNINCVTGKLHYCITFGATNAFQGSLRYKCGRVATPTFTVGKWSSTAPFPTTQTLSSSFSSHPCKRATVRGITRALSTAITMSTILWASKPTLRRGHLIFKQLFYYLDPVLLCHLHTACHAHRRTPFQCHSGCWVSHLINPVQHV